MYMVRKEVVFSVACAMALASCSTAPIVRWKRNGLAESGASMEAAVRYLDGARTAYRDTVADQMAREANLSTALVGAGALVAILAASTAHRDAVFGVAAAGGTAYALGNMNIRRPRVQIYQAGVEALNCAQRAVIPFDIPKEEAQDLAQMLGQLDESRRILGDTLRQAQAFGNPLPPALIEAIARAVQARQAADTSLKSGRQFLNTVNRASRELVAAVDRIDAAIARAVIDSTPDLSNVPKVISGLAGMMGSFAPGAGLDARVAQGLANRAAEKGASIVAMSAGPETRDEQLVRQLTEDTLTTASDAASIDAFMEGRVVAWPEETFKDCGVTQAMTELSLNPASLVFVQGVEARRVVEIQGGVKPYFVEVDGQMVDGVTVRPPIRFDNRVEVGVASKVTTPHTLNLRVSDSSPTAKVLNLPLSIGPATPAAAAPPAAAPPAAPGGRGAGTPAVVPNPSAAVSTAQAKLQQIGSFAHANKQFFIGRPRIVDANTVEVLLACPVEKTPEKYKQADLVDSLLRTAGLSRTGPGGAAWALKFKSTANAKPACLAD